MKEKLVLIALGGALGSVLRYLIWLWLHRPGPSAFPLATLVVNVTGCFAIGILNPVLLGPHVIREEYRLALVTGVLGGFTTFSAYGWETLTLTSQGAWLVAAGNLLFSNCLGLAAAWAGIQVARAAFGA